MSDHLTDIQEKRIREQYNVLKSNATSIVEPAELLKKIEMSVVKNKPLHVKLGLDPSAPDIHLGHLVVLKKLKEFQKFGHIIQLVIGDFTGMIGDPTGKSEARNQLSKANVEKNAQTYVAQFARVLDMDQVEIHYNSTWLASLDTRQLIDILSTTTVARMLERNDFTKRFSNQTPIYLHEFLYPLFQGYDSVALHTDVELGGNDQRYNLLVGRHLQEHFNQEKQVILTMPLLIGLDGKLKMSKSKNNYIGINESPENIFGKIMSISDSQMLDYYKLISSFGVQKIENLELQLKNGEVNPRDVKAALAKDIITQLYDSERAQFAETEFKKVFSQKSIPSHITEFDWLWDKTTSVQELFTKTGLLSSKSAVTRMLNNGGLRINAKKLSESQGVIEVHDGMVVQVGKRNFLKIRLNK
ncbi:tyrosine--tRNA ligase [Lactiplantibacillus sp. WILCCON 0030]|uniref:Tyrosine--tRNA ligase n=1 Tax=Lactiplantibacillus brownii TaxID=3069269 RepID=A0ABU1A9E4_9LACO|nr:tyrosine--tRNA ligase [Lactiplantibacillus brownii]MDQ7937541.1 tyrosine--tRNA ligase [Lactiplantibacillus brownii]